MSPAASTKATEPVSVLLVDDNLELGRALSVGLRNAGFDWRGQVMRADFLAVYVQAECPDVNVMLMDVDMPGKDPLAELADFSAHFPSVRTIIFSAYCTSELVDAAIQAGASGYVCKIDGFEALVEGIRSVMAGRVYFSPHACEVRLEPK